MESSEELFAELEAVFERIEIGVVECRKLQAEHLERLVDEEIDAKLNDIEPRIHQTRDEILKETSQKLIQALANVSDLVRLFTEPKVDITRELYVLNEPTANVDSVGHNLLLDLRYKNALDIRRKIAYLDLYNELARIELDNKFSSSFLIPLSRNRLFAFNFEENVMSIVNTKGRVLCECKGLKGRTYKIFKAYRGRIVANGVFESGSPYENHKDTFLDVYDSNLHLKATKKFRLFTQVWLGNVDHANEDMFMYMSIYKGQRKCTVYEYDLNEVHSFFENTTEHDGPYFFNGERIQQFTKKYLFLFDHNQKILPKNHMRVLDLYTGMNLASIPMESPRLFAKFLFDQTTESVQVINYNKQRKSIQVLSIPDGQLIAENVTCDDLFNNFEYLTGITENYEIFHIDLNKKKLIFI